MLNIAYFVPATTILLIVGVLVAMTNTTADPREDLQTAIAVAISLLEAKDYVPFLNAFVLPDTLRRITDKGSIDVFAGKFRDNKATRLLQVLKATKDIEPTLEPEGKSATFKLIEEIGRKNSIVFTKIGRYWYLDSSPVREQAKLQPGNNAPEFSVETASGRKIHSAELRGKIVALHFWATWCGPCIRQMPTHIQSLEQYPSSDVEVIFVCLDDNDDVFASTVDNFKIPFNNVTQPDGWADFGVELLPFDVVIDREGKVVSNSINDIAELLATGDGRAKP